jgi:RNA polymerase sigma factor (sigma-70 family)
MINGNVNTQKRKKRETTRDLRKQIKIFEEATGKDFVEFYNKYLPKLIYFCSKYFKGDEDLANDTAQDAFFLALDKIDSYNPEKAAFSTWLFTIARNESLQVLKKNARIPTVSMDMKVDDEGTTIQDFISDKSDGEPSYMETHNLNLQKSNLIKEKIELLKPAFKEVIQMRDVKNMSYKDIAITLGEDVTIEIEATDGFIKLPKELSKIYSIEALDGSKVRWEVDIQKDTPFYTHIKVDKTARISGRNPYNLSTIKSRIRGGRLKLQEMVQQDFDYLDNNF